MNSRTAIYALHMHPHEKPIRQHDYYFHSTDEETGLRGRKFAQSTGAGISTWAVHLQGASSQTPYLLKPLTHPREVFLTRIPVV